MRVITIFTIVVLLFIINLLNAQNNIVLLKVIDINELDDKVFEIRALTESSDTIRILSVKESIPNDSCSYEKIRKGSEYQFELQLPLHTKPLYVLNLTFRVKGKVYWTIGDNPKDMPYFANNIKSDYIKPPDISIDPQTGQLYINKGTEKKLINNREQ
ncbi:MAG: hypothetical protein LBS01_11145 [Prevotellaceae bacterium]|jgi:hypothetical protein|nr:hypothetical protein [Prevotellaceae bacterium]